MKSIEFLKFMMIIFNSGLRLNYPSAYNPATQVKKGILYSPIFARSVATIAEFIFYKSLTNYYGLCFYPNIYKLTLIGECLSWCYLLLQSNLFGYMEDSIWTLLQVCLIYNSVYKVKYIISGPYLLYMLIYHLPKTYELIDNKKLISYYKGATICNPDSYSLQWICLSLFFKPIIYLITVI